MKSMYCKILIIYYGVIQAVHLIALGIAFVLLLRHGQLSFLAQSPPDGWTDQAMYFLIATGIIDAVNIILTFLFLYAYWGQKRGWFYLGQFVTTVSIVSAVIYGFGTYQSGAWPYHPVEYALLCLLFVPILLLFIQFAKRGLNMNVQNLINKSI